MRRVAFSLNAALALATIACSTYRGQAVDPIFSKYGTGTLLHPIQEPDIVASDCPATKAAKEHIHIFAVNGLNPMCLGNFNGLCEYLKRQGYTNTYFGQLYTCANFADRARQVRQADPEAKIVLIGFSLGANSVRTIANDLAKDGTSVDLLVYMVGDYVYNKPASRPDNVRRILNIRAQGIVLTGGDLMFNGEDIDGARNHRLNVRHILVPSRRETLELLTNELAGVVAETKPAAATAVPVKELPPTVTQRGTSPYNSR
ncbi:MAG: hypothetical protein K1X57_04540 [Gemmataceae bacterium]|nr:hypothetical protein [Gemmataceae bacterium]